MGSGVVVGSGMTVGGTGVTVGGDGTGAGVSVGAGVGGSFSGVVVPVFEAEVLVGMSSVGSAVSVATGSIVDVSSDGVATVGVIVVEVEPETTAVESSGSVAVAQAVRASENAIPIANSHNRWTVLRSLRTNPAQVFSSGMIVTYSKHET